MPKKPKKTAADQSLPKRHPKSGSSARVKRSRSAASVQKGGKGASATRPPCEKCGQVHKRCTAHNKAGGPCGQQARRGSATCRNHGGNAPQVRKAANERLVAMVIPALAQLERVLTKPDTSDADRIKAALAILNRTGYAERHQVELGLREPTPFDNLDHTAFTILRGRQAVTWDTDEPDALSSGGGEDDEALNDLLDQRERSKQREAETKLDNDGHVVVKGRATSPDESNMFGFERTRAEKYRESGTTELDPDGTQPEKPTYADYERRVAEAQDPPPGPRRRR